MPHGCDVPSRHPKTLACNANTACCNCKHVGFWFRVAICSLMYALACSCGYSIPHCLSLVGSSACYITCWLILLRASSEIFTQDAWILVAPLANALSPKLCTEHARESATMPVSVPYAKTCHPKRVATPPTQPAKGSQGHDSTQSVVKLTDKGRGRGGGRGRGKGRDRGRGRGRGRGKYRAQTGNNQEAEVCSMIQGKSAAKHVSHCAL